MHAFRFLRRNRRSESVWPERLGPCGPQIRPVGPEGVRFRECGMIGGCWATWA